MKKFYSLLLIAMAAMLCLQAKAAIYLVGDAFSCGWNPESAIEMTVENDSIYTYTAEANSGSYFAFLCNGKTWDDQRGPLAGDGSSPTGEWEPTTAKGAWCLNATGTYTFKYNINSNQALITVEDPQVIEDNYYLIGEFNGWNTETQVPFQKNGNTFELTQTFQGEFKIRDANGTWYGGTSPTADSPTVTLSSTGGNMNLPDSAEYTLSITYGELTVTGFPSTSIQSYSYKVVMAPGGDWDNKEEIDMSESGTGYTATAEELMEGSEFKIVKEIIYDDITPNEWIWYGAEAEGDSYWVTNELLGTEIQLYGGDGYKNLYLVNGGNYTFQFDPATNKLIVNGIDELNGISIKGSTDSLWSNITTLELVKDAQTNNWVLADQAIEAGFEFKVVKNMSVSGEAWYGMTSEGNNYWVTEELLGTDLATTTEGNNLYFENSGTFTFTFNPETNVLNITGEFDPEVFETYIYSLYYAPGGDWDNQQHVPLDADEDGKYITTEPINMIDSTEFKITKLICYSNDSEPTWVWYGAEADGEFFWVTSDLLDTEIQLHAGDGYKNLYFEKSGTFSFTFDPATQKLTVTGTFDIEPDPENTTYSLYLAPGGNWDEMVTVAMPKNMDNGNNEANNVAIEAGSEFKVVKKVTEEGADDTLVWYGAEAEGESYWVTDELLGTEIQLFDGDGYKNLYFENAGNYSFSFNNKTLKLVVNKNAADYILGDVNGDGSVDVSDMNIIINIMLGIDSADNYDGRAYLTEGDTEVDVSDMNLCINIMLGIN